jgi:AraC-like DNA-binding protein
MDDLLSQVLAELRIESTLYGRIALGATAGLAYPAHRAAAFHLNTVGGCHIVLDGERHVLDVGDFVVLPRGDPHRVQAGPLAQLRSVDEVLAGGPGADAVHVGPGEPASEYVCGALHFRGLAEHPLLAALPAVLVIRAEQGEPHPWLRSHLDALAYESRSGRPGGNAVITRLSEVLFVQAIRSHLSELPEGAGGWLAVLREPQLRRTVALMHRAPDRAWTVAALAGEAGMSRSHFAERFTAVLGRPPLAYLAEWRMHVGRALLREGTLRVGEVARRVGYGSEAAFSTAFKRATGVAPGGYRRTATA